MRGVTRTSIETPSTFNSKHHIANCIGNLIRRIWPHPLSEAACANPFV